MIDGVLRQRMRQRRVRKVRGMVLSEIGLLRVRGLGIWALCFLWEVDVET